MRELVRDADIVVENFRPGQLVKWNICWDTLLALNPKLIKVRVPGYGKDGTYRDRPGLGVGAAEAMSGMRYVTSYPEQPCQSPAFTCDNEGVTIFV